MTEVVAPPTCLEDTPPDLGPYDVDRIAQVAKALAHPARIRIIAQFEADEPHLAKEIVGNCELAQSTVSEHLRILRDAGVLYATKDGPRMWYCLRRTVLRDYLRAVEDLLWGLDRRG